MKNIKLKSIVYGFIVCSVIVSCKKENSKPTTETQISNPTLYAFVDGSSLSTVNYDDQKLTIKMIDEIAAVMSDTISDSKNDLYAMMTGKMFSNVNLTNSNINLVDKTDNIQFFKSVFEMSQNATSSKMEAKEGVAGKYLNRFFNSNGIEPLQLFKKGIMGACLLNQVLLHNLNTAILDAGTNKTDNTNRVMISGKNYTAMEHLWDEAYGYIFGGDIENSSSPEYNYWSEYLHIVNTDKYFNTIKSDVINAFIKGRIAITNKEYTTRDAQIAIIQKSLSKVSAVRGVFYLTNEGKKGLTDDGGKGAFHALSEAYGFIWALKYSYNPDTKAPYFTENEIDAILGDLLKGKNGLYDLDYLNANLNLIAEKIASRFGFTVDQAYINED